MPHNKKNQEIREQIILARFKNHFPEFPKGIITKSESPDFIVKTGKKHTIGIELTSILKHRHETDVGGNHLETPELVPEIIEKTIQIKENKLVRYRQKKLDEIWLIIEVQNIMNNTSFNISNKLNNWNFISEFNKIYLFESVNKKVFELK